MVSAIGSASGVPSVETVFISRRLPVLMLDWSAANQAAGRRSA
jgi:hypothetical protein